MASGKLMLVDGNSILNRAFYGLQGQNLLATSEGLYTNAVFGFLNILFKYLEEEKPDYLGVAFDLKAPTFRHKEFQDYKATRKGMPPELAVQLPVMKDVLDAMSVKRLELEGFEADDILGSISLCAENEGMEVIIVTGDRDALQLANKTTRIKIPTTRKGRTETEEYDSQRVIEKYGVSPRQLIDVKGLMGDKSDNIPGVAGIGEKTALELILKFSSLDSLYEALEEVERKSVRDKLEANREIAFISRKLATIERNMPVLCQLDELKRGEFDNERLYELFRKLEFKSFIDKLNLRKKASVQKETRNVRCLDRLTELASLKESIKAAGEVAVSYLVDRTESTGYYLSGIAFARGEDDIAFVDMGLGICEDEFLSVFREVFEDPAIKKYGHDVKGLVVYLKQKGIDFKGLSFDTMLAAYIINPSRDSYTVSELAREYLDMDLETLEQQVVRGRRASYRDIEPGRLSMLCGVHADTIYLLKPILEGIIKKNLQEMLYYGIELPLVEVLADMEYHGFKVNIDALKSFSKRLDEDIKRLIYEVYELAGEEFNLNSPKQMGVILFDKLKLPALKKTKTGYSTDAEVLEQLAEKHAIVNKILEYRQVAKLKSTYVEGLLSVINPYTGRIHSSFNQTVVVTGRISSTEPNLQNIPVKLEMGREIRKVFVPGDERHILADADYSQIELRVLAHITGDENLIGAFINNEDIHTDTAARVFGIKKEEVTPLMRTRAKAVNFGIVYGIGDFSLSKDLGVTRKEARKYIDEYLDKYPKVRQYMHDIVEQGRQSGFVTTLFNRRRYLPELSSSNFNMRSSGERIAMNTPIQGSAADIIKIAMVKVYNELKKRSLKSRLILQVHDELLVETYISEREEVSSILKECMESAAELHVPLTAEVKSGNSWYETK